MLCAIFVVIDWLCFSRFYLSRPVRYIKKQRSNYFSLCVQ
jgi:hypothetical protein